MGGEKESRIATSVLYSFEKGLSESGEHKSASKISSPEEQLLGIECCCECRL